MLAGVCSADCDIETRNWVTMGSPLKSTTDKPVRNTGNWINLFDLNDPVVHLAMFPPFPSTPGMAGNVGNVLINGGGPGLTKNQNVSIQREYDFRTELQHKGWVHSDYWISPKAATELRKRLQ